MVVSYSEVIQARPKTARRRCSGGVQVLAFALARAPGFAAYGKERPRLLASVVAAAAKQPSARTFFLVRGSTRKFLS